MSNTIFSGLPPTPAQHFRLYFFAAVLHLLDQLSISSGSREATLEQFPFLVGYEEEFAGLGLEGLDPSESSAWWWDALEAWEATVPGHLPMRALRRAGGVDHSTLTLLLTIGLTEEDARFGLVFEAAQGTPGHRRPTQALLSAWWRDSLDGARVRENLRWLRETGLVQVVNPEAPRLDWAVQPAGLLWDALRGEAEEWPTPWARYHPPAALKALDELIIASPLGQVLARLPRALDAGEVPAVIVRGPRHNGRRTALGAVARAMGRGMLEVHGPAGLEPERWKLVGPLATLLHALPVVVLDLSPGDTAQLLPLVGSDSPLGVVLGRKGGVLGPPVERALGLVLEVPDADARRRHWVRGLGGDEPPELDEISRRFRLTGGYIRRAAGSARAVAALDDRRHVRLADARAAIGVLGREALDTLAVRLDAPGDWGQLSVKPETLGELLELECRCRHREALPGSVGSALAAQLTPGVRALFTGPSGTGKSMAARVLASALQVDLYRLDLSAVVNKFIGETEKNLDRIFTLAEELDVILLLDEGDALMTQRTAVQTSNDRHANLETNYLLQRIESYEGILIVTTNAPDRIDGAFRRRMDAVVDFAPPGPTERWSIWQSHLPERHEVDPGLLQELASRCTLTGGQIRNAVLHAALLAVADDRAVTSAHVRDAVQREYRKAGSVYPLARQSAPTRSRG